MLLGNRRALSLFIIRSLSRNSVFVDRRMNVFCAINTSRKTHPWLTLLHKYIRTHTHSYFHSSHKYKHGRIAYKYHAISVHWFGQDLYICTSVYILHIFYQNIIIQHRLTLDISNKCTNTVMHIWSCVCMREKLVRNDLVFSSNAQWTFIRWKCTNTHSRIHTRTMICSMVTPADALQSTVVRICVIMMRRKAFSKDQYFMCACVRIAAVCMYVHES